MADAAVRVAVFKLNRLFIVPVNVTKVIQRHLEGQTVLALTHAINRL